ncbi:ROK family protein [Catenuloplanes japonicus]|uniref:ROK family protein n=1 Tax=Catenuloplanes japonicus TaxID=33876 RepID=UPI0005276F95|nr:ROK family protein [Catenuloplanes japonicus]
MIPAVELGGSHVSATRVSPVTWTARDPRPPARRVSPHATAQELITAITNAALSAGPLADLPLCLAVPGPFDYAEGIGRYTGVGKFDAINGVDLRSALYTALGPRPAEISFVNDAVAFGIGEWVAGAARGLNRIAAITLGTGVGSAFIDRGHVVQDGPSVPPQGRADLLDIDGRPLEETVSTRGILRAHGRPATGVIDVIRAGNLEALDAYRRLGAALAPWVNSFAAQAVVVGGAVAQSWNVIGPLLTAGLHDGGSTVNLLAAANPHTATHIGAAWLTSQRAVS